MSACMPSVHTPHLLLPEVACLRHQIQLVAHAGMLAYAPRFSKYIHACACLHVDAVSELPYWFLPNGDGSLSPASWEEMADSPVVSLS